MRSLVSPLLWYRAAVLLLLGGILVRLYAVPDALSTNHGATMSAATFAQRADIQSEKAVEQSERTFAEIQRMQIAGLRCR